MTYYIYLILALVAIYFSYLFTLIENAYLALGSVKLSRLEDLEVKNISVIKKLVKKENIYSTTLILDYFSNSLSIIFTSLLLRSLRHPWACYRNNTLYDYNNNFWRKLTKELGQK